MPPQEGGGCGESGGVRGYKRGELGLPGHRSDHPGTRAILLGTVVSSSCPGGCGLSPLWARAGSCSHQVLATLGSSACSRVSPQGTGRPAYLRATRPALSPPCSAAVYGGDKTRRCPMQLGWERRPGVPLGWQQSSPALQLSGGQGAPRGPGSRCC